MRFIHSKQEFIDDYSGGNSTSKVLKDLFNRISKYEEEWGEDICCRPASDIERVFNEVSGMRTRSKLQNKYLIMNYLEWCISHGYRAYDMPMPNFDMADTQLARRRMVASPEHLQSILDEVFDPEDECTYDNAYRCLMWLAFIGLDKNQALSVTVDEVDLDNMRIVYNGREYLIYKEAIPTMRNCVELDWFEDAAQHRKANRSCSKQLLRGKADATYKNMSTVFGIKLNRAKDKAKAKGTELNIEINHNRVLASGEFYRMYEAERNGVVLDFVKLAIASALGKDRESMTKYKQTQLGKYYKQDYEQWKLAFADYLNK